MISNHVAPVTDDLAAAAAAATAAAAAATAAAAAAADTMKTNAPFQAPGSNRAPRGPAQALLSSKPCCSCN
jgi:hypothetical protein